MKRTVILNQRYKKFIIEKFRLYVFLQVTIIANEFNDEILFSYLKYQLLFP
jgi:hypothetical protein